MHIRFICFGLILLIAPLELWAENPAESLKDRLEKLVLSEKVNSYEIETICEECIGAPSLDYYPALKKLLDRTLEADQKANPDFGAYYVISPLVSALCEVDGRKGYAAAARRYGTLPVNSELQSGYLNALLPYACKLQIKDAMKKKNKIQVDFPVVSSAVPDALSDLSRDLLDVWRYYKNATAPYERYNKQMADKEMIDVNYNWPQFYKVMQETLTQPKVDTLTCIMSFEYGGRCGTGREGFYGPQSRAILSSLVKNGQFAESIGAALELEPPVIGSMFGYRNDHEFEWQKQLIELVRLDWEKLYLGAYLDSMGYGRDYLLRLASHGSEKTALYMVQIAPFARKHEFYFSHYTDSIATMIKRKNTISAKTRKKLLDLLHESVNTEAKLSEIEAAVTTLAELKRPESIPVLKRASKHPHYFVAKAAAMALRGMGISVPIPPPPKPVPFLLSHNGKPLSKEHVDYRIIGTEGGSLGSRLITNDQGRLNLNGEDFIATIPAVKRIEFSSESLDRLDQVVFVTSVAPPFDREHATKVQIRTHALTVTLNNLPDPNALKGQPMILKLEYLEPLQSVEEYPHYSVGGKITLVPTKSCVFPCLGDGRYRLTVKIPGRARWESKEIVMDRDRELVIDLKPGADLYFKIKAPGGQLADTQVEYNLEGPIGFSKFRYFDLKGLPAGKYNLKILSSEEKRKRSLMRGRKSNITQQCNNRLDYSGKEIPFTISRDVPLVDLGTIRLLPVDAK